VRAYTPWPGAFARLPDGSPLKIHATRVVPHARGLPRCGHHRHHRSQQGFIVACGHGSIELTEVQPGSRKRMSAVDFLRGHGTGIGTGARLESNRTFLGLFGVHASACPCLSHDTLKREHRTPSRTQPLALPHAFDQAIAQAIVQAAGRPCQNSISSGTQDIAAPELGAGHGLAFGKRFSVLSATFEPGTVGDQVTSLGRPGSIRWP